MSDLIGRIIAGRYGVEAFLGHGGMADVYKVWDQRRTAYLAMKVLHEDLAEDNVFLRRFKREAQTLARLQHPNIVRFYGLEEDGDLAFLLMDYIEGTTLRKEIHRLNGQPFLMQRILEIMRPVCSALHYAHQSGFVHCDVKPANIMIHTNGTVLVSDFGIARISEASTATLVGAGTPAYMAPEQARGENPTPQTDIYALGVVLFEMLTGGERPFTGESAQIAGSNSEKIRWEQMKLDPPSPRKFVPTVSPGLEMIVMKCLSKDETKRYSNTLQLLNDLRQAFGEKLGGTELIIEPELLDFGAINLNSKPINQPELFLKVTNFAGGNTKGRIVPEVPWLDVNPVEFTCEAGQASVHKITLKQNLFFSKNQKDYSFQKVISVQADQLTHFVPISYKIIPPRSFPIWAPVLAFMIVLIGVLFFMNSGSTTHPNVEPPVALSYETTPTTYYQSTAAPIVVAHTAANMNLVPSDIGLDYSIDKELGPANFSSAIDGNGRILVNANHTWYVASNVEIFSSTIQDNVSVTVAPFETNLSSANSSVKLSFNGMVLQNIGDQAESVEYSAIGPAYRGAFLVFKKGDVLVILDVSNTLGLSALDNLLAYGKILEKLIDQPRDTAKLFASIPTATSISTLVAQTGNNSDFSTYHEPSGAFKADIPSQGCSQMSIGVGCALPNNGGIMDIVSEDFSGTLNVGTSQTMVIQALENMKPIGMLVSYSDVTFVSSDNGMYVYSFSFKHPTVGNGQGYLGYKADGGKLFAIEFFTFDLQKCKKYWDTAYQTFQTYPK